MDAPTVKKKKPIGTPETKEAAARFATEIKRLGYSQRGFARLFGNNDRTVRRWCEGEQDIPEWVWIVLGMLDLLDRIAAGDSVTTDEIDALIMDPLDKEAA